MVADGPDLNAGRVYLFRGSASGLQAPRWTADGQRRSNCFGSDGAGRVDGAGYADVLVGPEQLSDSPTSAYAARAHLSCDSPSCLGANPDWATTGTGTWSWLGSYVAGAGDIDGDGFDDILVSGLFDGGGAGRAYLYRGAAHGPVPVPWGATGAAGEPTGAGFSSGLSSAGDVNGDRYDDVVIGAHGYADGTNGYPGRLNFYLGDADADRDGVYVGGDGAPDARDCDDSNPFVHRDAAEVCDSLDVDEDCNGAADDEDAGVDPATFMTFYPDDAGDGFGANAGGAASADPPEGWSPVDGDCDALDPATHPSAAEIPGNGAAEDCDGGLAPAMDTGEPATKTGCGCGIASGVARTPPAGPPGADVRATPARGLTIERTTVR